MQNQIDHDKLIRHAHKLDSEAKKWTERELRSTYSRAHLPDEICSGSNLDSAKVKPAPGKTKELD